MNDEPKPVGMTIDEQAAWLAKLRAAGVQTVTFNPNGGVLAASFYPVPIMLPRISESKAEDAKAVAAEGLEAWERRIQMGASGGIRSQGDR